MSDLESILSGEQPEPVAEVEAEPVAEEAEAPEQPAEAAPEVETPAPEPQMVPVGVVQGLRDEIRALKSQMPKPAEAPAPDFYADPQAAVQHQVAPIRSEIDNVRLNMSEEMAIQTHGEDKVKAAFQALTESQDGMAAHQSIMQSRSPYHALVDWHQKQVAVQDIGDPDAYREKVRGEIRAELEAEMVAKQAKDAAAQVAPSMANVTGAGGGSPAWSGPADLGDLIG